MSTEVGPTNTTPVQGSAHVHLAWRDVILFVVLAYGLVWAWSGFWLLPYLGDLLTRSTTPTDMLGRLGAVATLPTMLAPMIAALVMRIFVGKEGVKGSLGLLRSPKYYLAALVVPAVFVTAVVLIVQALGLGEFSWSEANWFVYLLLLLIALPVILFTFGEEYGWRGYLLPRLLPLGEIRVSLLLGVIWGVWHLPLLLAGLNYPGVNVWLAIIVFTFVTVALSFTYTWFYVASGGSVLVAAVFHASTNQFSDTVWGPPLLGGEPVRVEPHKRCPDNDPCGRGLRAHQARNKREGSGAFRSSGAGRRVARLGALRSVPKRRHYFPPERRRRISKR